MWFKVNNPDNGCVTTYWQIFHTERSLTPLLHWIIIAQITRMGYTTEQGPHIAIHKYASPKTLRSTYG